MTITETIDQLRRQRWILIAMTVVCLGLFVRNELVMRQGRRLLRR